jgi:hypothetical protein
VFVLGLGVLRAIVERRAALQEEWVTEKEERPLL